MEQILVIVISNFEIVYDSCSLVTFSLVGTFQSAENAHEYYSGNVFFFFYQMAFSHWMIVYGKVVFH